MKSILRILVLGVVPILAVTAVVDQGLAADKGSQLIFQSSMAHTSYISVVNASPVDKNAVTVLVQYYNNEMEMVVWYLRVIPWGTNVLVNPFDHEIPGSGDPEKDIPNTNVGDAIMASGKTGNGHFVIAVTAVGANIGVDDMGSGGPDPGTTIQATEMNQENTVNVLFPTFLAKDLHGTNNIDNCGVIIIENATGDTDEVRMMNNSLIHTEHGDDGVNDCADGTVGEITKDMTSKNVGGLSILNAVPVSFNHLTGNFTEALTSTADGGADQTASWGGTPVVRPAVRDTNNTILSGDYNTLNGKDTDDVVTVENGVVAGGRLAEKDAAGMEVDTHDDDPDVPGTNGHDVTGFFNIGDNLRAGSTPQVNLEEAGDDGKIIDGTRIQRGLNSGALVLPALYGGGDMAHQIMLLLSVADDFGTAAGEYELIPAMTGIKVIPIDPMGNPLDMEDPAGTPVFGSGAEADDADVAGQLIIVNGVQVMTDADLAKCTGTMIDGPWSLAHLTSIIPEVSAGGNKFAGLDADPGMMTASPGWIKFERSALTCKKDYGDGDSANLASVENPDGVPVSDERTFKAGTLIVEEKSQSRAFVTTGRALLKFITPGATFAASWTLKSPPSLTMELGDATGGALNDLSPN